jgi:hypothetical protein
MLAIPLTETETSNRQSFNKMMTGARYSNKNELINDVLLIPVC